MDSQKSSYEDLLNLTDTESSSSHTGLFETNEQIVLELHDIKSQDPAPQTEATDSKKKRRKKRIHPATDKSTTSTSSTASDSEPKLEDLGKEEFYDAKGSVHALPGKESQVKPAGTIVLAQAHSEHGQDPKAPRAERPSATQRQPSTISKPVAPPDS